MAFRGWPVEAVEFFEGLEADNSKSYWQANKHVYESAVKGPMEELLAELAPEFGEPRLFRPYRDVRFSRDKAPYKTNIAALLGGFGNLELSSRGLAAGGGAVHLAPDQLDRYRRAVDDEKTGTALEEIVASIEAQGHDCGPHEALKTAPRGYPKDHPRIELLRMKGCIAWRSWEIGAWLDTHAPIDRVTEFLETAQPLVDWLDAHVGPSELEGAWG